MKINSYACESKSDKKIPFSSRFFFVKRPNRNFEYGI